MQKKHVFLILVLVGAAPLIKGCVVAAAAGAGAGTVAYVRGDLETLESKSLEAVYAATLKAMRELELKVTKKTKDALSAVIIARDAQDKKIKIKLQTTTEKITKLSIRIGTFGNETKSNLIYQKIRENL